MLPFVFIPGLLGSPRLYQQQTHALWQHAPVMIANSSQDDSLPAIARRILAAAPARFILLGLSMGGYVAFEILRQAPERVQRLILLDTSARPDTPEAKLSREQQIQAASEGAFLTLIEDAYRFCVHPSRLEDQVLRTAMREMAQDVGPAGFIRQQRAIMSRVDSRPLLPQIACPSLVLVGDSDRLTPPEAAQEIAGAIPGATLITVPVCGHVSTLEQPAFVNQAIVNWLQRT